MFILLLNLFTLYTLHGIIIGYPPRLPQHATDDNRQVCKSKQHIHRPAERNLFCELVHPDAVDIPRSNNADKHRRGCHIEHIARQQFQYHARFRAVHLADGNLLAAAAYFVGGITYQTHQHDEEHGDGCKQRGVTKHADTVVLFHNHLFIALKVHRLVGERLFRLVVQLPEIVGKRLFQPDVYRP